MINNLKALFVVLVISQTVFFLAKPYCLKYVKEEAFNTRRAIWTFLTCVVFISPSFWLYAFCAVATIAWSKKREESPLSLYLMLLYVAPHVTFYIPVVGINQLFLLSNARLMTIFLLLPLLFHARSKSPRENNAWLLPDILLLLFCLMQVAMYAPTESVTAVCRRAFLLFLDVFLPYLAFSRFIRNKEELFDVIATFSLAVAILGPIGLFEALRNWLLYSGVAEYWGSSQPFAWLFRAGALRAQASTGHSLALGFLSAIAFTFCLYFSRGIEKKSARWAMLIWMWIGLYAAYSRGPWITAVFALFLYLFLMPRGFTRAIKGALSFAILAALLSITPIGDRFINALPFIGKVNQDTVDYRVTLFDTALELIAKNPWFGDVNVTQHMEHLRQGQGIIDIVNGYLVALLYYGIVGFTLVSLFQVLVTLKTYAASRSMEGRDEGMALIGIALAVAMCGSILFVTMAGFELIMWIFAGVAISLVRIVKASRARSQKAVRPTLAQDRS